MKTKTLWRSFWLSIATLSSAVSVCAQNAAEYKERTEVEKSWPKEAVHGAHGMVATDEELASRAGVEILQRGGNAVDAAVATAFALAVVEPAAGNIGGGGFMLVRMADGRTSFLDYREVAPGKATRDMYIKPDGKLDNELSVIGYKSVAVPGTVAGLELSTENVWNAEAGGRDGAGHSLSGKRLPGECEAWRTNSRKRKKICRNFR